jgi:hypothetical protein
MACIGTLLLFDFLLVLERCHGVTRRHQERDSEVTLQSIDAVYAIKYSFRVTNEVSGGACQLSAILVLTPNQNSSLQFAVSC